MDIYRVEISKLALKQLKKVPKPVFDKFLSWVEAIELEGLNEVKKLPGFRDKSLIGTRRGQRSIID